jgi:hypothetical protein
MPRIYTHEDLTGRKFGRWTVIKESDRKPVKNGSKPARLLVAWLCRCACGKETSVLSGDLVNGHSQSCGCLKEERRIESISKPSDYVAVTLQTLIYKGAAKRRNISWKLSREQVTSIIFRPCVYCGCPPSSPKIDSQGNLIGYASGIDRVDNSLGYEEGNVVPCCGPCNKAKGTGTYQDFIKWIDRLVGFRSSPGDVRKYHDRNT